MKKLLVSALALLALAISPALGQVGGGVFAPSISQATADARYCKLTGCTMTGGITRTMGTMTGNFPIITGSETWNNNAFDYFLWDYTVTNTLAGANSSLIRLTVGGLEVFRVYPSGYVAAGLSFNVPLGGSFGTAGRGTLTHLADGVLAFTTTAGTVGFSIDGATAGTVKLRNLANSADATLTAGATTLSAALTYGGVTLSNAVTGTGNMVLSAGPTLTGTLTAAAITASGAVQTAGNFTMTAGTFQYIAAGGSADVQTLTYSPAVTAYATGAMYCFRAVGTNTVTTPTFNVNGLGAKTGVKRAATALAAGDVVINGHYCGIYNGTNLQILNPTVP